MTLTGCGPQFEVVTAVLRKDGRLAVHATFRSIRKV
jgi:hypothetical protein